MKDSYYNNNNNNKDKFVNECAVLFLSPLSLSTYSHVIHLIKFYIYRLI